MATHASFAAVAVIGETVAQEVVRIYHGVGALKPRFVARKAFAIAGQAITVDYDLLAGVPALKLPPSPNAEVGLNLDVWGDLGITIGGRSYRSGVRIRASLTVPVRGACEKGTFRVMPDADRATVDTFDLQLLDAGFAVPARDAVALPEIRAFLEGALRAALRQISTIIPSLEMPYFPDLGTTIQVTQVAVRSLGGALAVGIDISTPDHVFKVLGIEFRIPGITTQGIPQELTDFRAPKEDVAACVSHLVMPIFFRPMRERVQQIVAARAATLTTFDLSLQQGHLAVRVVAEHALGTGTVSFKAVPQLVRPAEYEEFYEETGEKIRLVKRERREELWVRCDDLKIDVDRPLWMDLGQAIIGVATLGVGAAVMQEFIDSFVGDIERGITVSLGAEVSAKSLVPRDMSFTLPGAPGAPLHQRIERWEIHPEGIFLGATLGATFFEGCILGETSMPAELAVARRHGYRAQLPFGVIADDPRLRVAWEVRRADTQAVIVHSDLPSPKGLDFELDISSPSLQSVSGFRVGCRVYRALGPIAVEVLKGATHLGLEDRLDRTHPYVRWEHLVGVPVVEKAPNGSLRQTGHQWVHRCSAIHRTDLAGRCKMAAKFSARAQIPDQTGSRFEYLEALPFPAEALSARRREVCDYCFFGGPDKREPLKLPFPK